MEESERKKGRPDSKKGREVVNFLIYLAIIITVALIIVNFVAQRTIVSGSSMESTLQNGDNLIVDKLTYRFKDPKRFEIVIFPDPEDESKYFIKRIIGLPGETIQILDDGEITIDGKVLKEHYGRETIEDGGIVSAPLEIKLRPGEFFVMGDNRNDSLDSRFPQVGPVDGQKFVGRALCRIYPFKHVRSLLPKEADK